MRSAVFVRAAVCTLAALLLGGMLCACAKEDTPQDDVSTPPAPVYELDLSGDTLEARLSAHPELKRLDLHGLGYSDLRPVARLKDLQWADLRGNRLDREGYEALKAALPDCEILWDIPVGGTLYAADKEQIVLQREEDLAYLPYFTALERVDATALDCAAAVAAADREYPDVTFIWTVSLCGRQFPGDSRQLDLSDYPAGRYDDLSALDGFQRLTRVDLRGWELTLDEMDALADRYPDIRFVFSFEVAGVPADGTTTELDISGNVPEDTAELERYLRHMPALTYLDMCDCGLSDDEMGALRQRWPQVKFVWIIHMDIWSLRTDTIAFSTQSSTQNPHKLTNDDIQVLRYCTDLKALDLGHHHITDVSVIGELTDLRVLILACNEIEDISPLANLHHLKYLEIFENRAITDLSPLAGLDELLDLNLICLYAVKDFSPLANLKSIERLWVSWTYISKEDVELLRSSLPDCVVFTERKEERIAGVWRSHERFFAMRDMYDKNYLHECFE